MHFRDEIHLQIELNKQKRVYVVLSKTVETQENTGH